MKFCFLKFCFLNFLIFFFGICSKPYHIECQNGSRFDTKLDDVSWKIIFSNNGDEVSKMKKSFGYFNTSANLTDDSKISILWITKIFSDFKKDPIISTFHNKNRISAKIYGAVTFSVPW